MENLKEAFDQFDITNTGKITMSDMNEVLRACNVQVDPKTVIYFFELADTTKDGKISYKEFYKVFERTCDLNENRSNQMELNWKMKLMKQINDTLNEMGQPLKELFDHIDKDKSNTINFDEFKKLFNEDLTIKLDVEQV